MIEIESDNESDVVFMSERRSSPDFIKVEAEAGEDPDCVVISHRSTEGKPFGFVEGLAYIKLEPGVDESMADAITSTDTAEAMAVDTANQTPVALAAPHSLEDGSSSSSHPTIGSTQTRTTTDDPPSSSQASLDNAGSIVDTLKVDPAASVATENLQEQPSPSRPAVESVQTTNMTDDTSPLFQDPIGNAEIIDSAENPSAIPKKRYPNLSGANMRTIQQLMLSGGLNSNTTLRDNGDINMLESHPGASLPDNEQHISEFDGSKRCRSQSKSSVSDTESDNSVEDEHLRSSVKSVATQPPAKRAKLGKNSTISNTQKPQTKDSLFVADDFSEHDTEGEEEATLLPRALTSTGSTNMQPNTSQMGPTIEKPVASQKKTKPRVKKPAAESKQAEYSALQLLQGLLGDDAVAARASHGDVEDAPALEEGGAKARMFAELLGKAPEQFLAESKLNSKQLNEATRRLGRHVLVAEKGQWRLKGMETLLYHHQALGFEAMTHRELRKKNPPGGILADSMGLGKTIQLLALIAFNRPKDSRPKPTLIVVPSSLLSQWKSEIMKHMSPKYYKPCQIYRWRANIDVSLLEQAMIVLTTYHEVSTALPFPKQSHAAAKDDEISELSPFNEGRKQSTYEKAMDYVKQNWEERKDLLRMTFHRVILDEAHLIKNHQSRVSIACRYLQAKRKWAVTATPLHNSLMEFFPYLNFLGVKSAEDFHQFKKTHGDQKSLDNQNRLAKLLSEVMIRRTQRLRMFGRPIVDIPLGTEETIVVTLTAAERIIYSILEKRFIFRINSYLANNKIRQKHTSILVMLLRLRQVVAHPLLVRNVMATVFTIEDFDEMEKQMAKIPEATSVTTSLAEWVKATREAQLKAGATQSETSEPRSSPVGGFGQSENDPFGKYVGALERGGLINNSVCQICDDIPMRPIITSCHHVFCSDCFRGEMESTKNDTIDGSLICFSCLKALDHDNPYKAFEEDPDNPVASVENHEEASMQSESRKDDCKFFLPDKIEPSSKLLAIKEIIQRILDKPRNNDKIVVFTQFRHVLHIFSRLAEESGWPVLMMSGEDKLEDRDKVLHTFSEDPEHRLLISGLKVGGVGLNLTCANHVFSVDLWWNCAVERQAFGRVFRIGQKKKTHFYRICAKNTVDNMLLRIQQRKVKAINFLMVEKDEEVEKLTSEELLSLFGETYINEKGIRQIRVYRRFPELKTKAEMTEEEKAEEEKSKEE